MRETRSSSANELDLNTAQGLAVLSVPPGSSALDVGSADGSIARRLVERGCEVWSVVPNAAAARQAAGPSVRVVVGDIEQLDLLAEVGDRRFDAILLLDVLGGLRDPADGLRTMSALLAPGGRIIASLPNVTHGAVRLNLLQGSFPYTDSGLLDRTRLRFFDRASAGELFRSAALMVVEHLRVTRGLTETELAVDPSRVPPQVLDDLAADPDAATYQFVIIAVPAEGGRLEAAHGSLADALQGRNEELTSRVRRLEAHARGLEEQAREHAETLDAATRRSDALAEELDLAHRRADELRAELTARMAELHDRHREVRHLAADLAVKDGFMAELREAAAAAEARAGRAAREQDAALQQEAAKDRLVAQLESERDAQAGAVRALESERDAQAGAIRALEGELAQRRIDAASAGFRLVQQVSLALRTFPPVYLPVRWMIRRLAGQPRSGGGPRLGGDTREPAADDPDRSADLGSRRAPAIRTTATARTSCRVGLLWDSLSQNVGDQAVGLSLLRLAREAGFEQLAPVPIGSGSIVDGFDLLVIGGGEILQPPGHGYYDVFRVPGNHILNTVGTAGEVDAAYLNDYRLVSVRSQADRGNLVEVDREVRVAPCLTVLFDRVVEAAEPIEIPAGAVGVHVHSSSFRPAQGPQALAALRQLARPTVLLPFTHYNEDREIQAVLAQQLELAPPLPNLTPDGAFQAVRRLEAFVTTSLHATIMAYIAGVPFVAIGYAPKVAHFLRERGLSHRLVGSLVELPDRLSLLEPGSADWDDRLAADRQLATDLLAAILGELDNALRQGPRRHRSFVDWREPSHPLQTNLLMTRSSEQYGHRVAERLAAVYESERFGAYRETLEQEVGNLKAELGRVGDYAQNLEAELGRASGTPGREAEGDSAADREAR